MCLQVVLRGVKRVQHKDRDSNLSKLFPSLLEVVLNVCLVVVNDEVRPLLDDVCSVGFETQCFVVERSVAKCL